jgi:hypothetical protein
VMESAGGYRDLDHTEGDKGRTRSSDVATGREWSAADLD